VGEQPQETLTKAFFGPEVVILGTDADLSSSGYRRGLAYDSRRRSIARKLYALGLLSARVRVWQRSLVWRYASSAGSGRTACCCACCSSPEGATSFPSAVGTGQTLRLHNADFAITRAKQAETSQKWPISYTRLPVAESAQRTGQQVPGDQFFSPP
jgi:hypothetical protein